MKMQGCARTLKNIRAKLTCAGVVFLYGPEWTHLFVRHFDKQLRLSEWMHSLQ